MDDNINGRQYTNGQVFLICQGSVNNRFEFILFTLIKQNQMKQYFCIGSYLPFDTINKSQINNSKAKQTFLFSKSKRFLQQKSNTNVISYSINLNRNKNEGPKIGTAQRQPMIIANDFPAPCKYRIKTQIEKDHHNISFGLGRQSIKAYNYLNIEAKNFPPSTKYEIQSKFKRLYKNAPIYSMKKRCSTQYRDEPSPGPAGYNVFAGRNRNQELTKYKSVSFSTGKCRRFNNDETSPPGPGAYKTYEGNVERLGGGSSRFHSSLSTKFTHAKRKTYIDDQTKKRMSLPGPGNYRAPSQFGQYDGNVYQMFQFTGKNLNSLGRPESGLEINLNQKMKRPQTSKH